MNLHLVSRDSIKEVHVLVDGWVSFIVSFHCDTYESLKMTQCIMCSQCRQT